MKNKILLVAVIALILGGCDWVRSKLDLPTSKDIAAKKALIIQREMQLDSARNIKADSTSVIAVKDSSKSLMGEDSAEMSAATQRAEQQRIADEEAVRKLDAQQKAIQQQKAEQQKAEQLQKAAQQKVAQQQKLAQQQKVEQQKLAQQQKVARQQKMAQQRNVAAQQQKAVQQQMPQQQNVVAQKDTPSPLRYRYYLIVGSYKQAASVEKRLRQLRNMEANPVAIPLRNGLTMVSAVGFNSLQDAEAAVSDVSDIAPDAWVYSRAKGLHK